MKDAYADSDILIVSACRTPIGRFCGSLASVPTHELGGRAISECIKMVRKFLSGRQSILCMKGPLRTRLVYLTSDGSHLHWY